MTEQTLIQSEAFLKRRKFLTVLPFIVLPFITVVFWLMGGGSGVVTEGVPVRKGLNTQLPDAKVESGSTLDKLSFYAMADRDSVKHDEQKRMDPNFSSDVTQKPVITQRLQTSTGKKRESDHTEELINHKIALLQKRISEPVTQKKVPEILEQPEQMITHRETDPEMDAINNTLEKLLDVQHPERVKERTVGKRAVGFPVSIRSGRDGIYFGREGAVRGEFLSTNNEINLPDNLGVVAAAIHGQQVVQNGSWVKLRLLQDVFVNEVQIPAGSFVYGAAELQNERLHLFITSIQYEKNLFPVALRVFDMDGVEGLNAPGSAAREVKKQSGEQAVQSIGIVNMDPSLKAQATAAGIGAAKSLLTKKVKLVQVTVKANYHVLLKDENAKEK